MEAAIIVERLFHQLFLERFVVVLVLIAVFFVFVLIRFFYLSFFLACRLLS